MLEYAVKNADIVLLQEPWIGNDNISISHPVFIKIAFDREQNVKARTMTCFKKCKVTLHPEYGISNDSDIQVLDISSNVENFIIFNVYNEKSQGEN